MKMKKLFCLMVHRRNSSKIQKLNFKFLLLQGWLKCLSKIIRNKNWGKYVFSSTLLADHRYLRKVDCSRHISFQKIHFNKSANSGTLAKQTSVPSQ
jgi:hypothetical protein